MTRTPASQSRARKKSGKDGHVAVEKASESEAEASAKAQQASKQTRQAADEASKAEIAGDASSKSVVSLETNPVAASASAPGAAITIAAVRVQI